MEGKIMSMKEAINKYVSDGESVYISGFTHLINFSAAHEIIRQKKRDLILARLTPDVVYDQMVAAKVAKKIIFSYLGNPGVGSLHCIRRSVEKGIPKKVEIEEYTHGSFIGAIFAGAANLPFYPSVSVKNTDLPKYNKNYALIKNPFNDEEITVVKPLRFDVAIIHVQRADKMGNSQIWGLIGEQKEVAFASKKVIISAEEIVNEDVIKRDPNRTIIPHFIVSAVVHEPWAAHPSYAQGFYDRDNEFYVSWDKISRDISETEKYLDEWIFSIENRLEYIKKLGQDKIAKLKMKYKGSGEINYGEVS
jgi:glutaconate CoA-transferase subunit A